MEHPYDRSAEDTGNIIAYEHLNTRVPDQLLATVFYLTGLGLTRDPYVMPHVANMWVNIGSSQFHLPTGSPQVLGGHVGVVVPSRQALRERMEAVRPLLAGTRYMAHETSQYLELTSPWGNVYRCFEASPEPGSVMLGVLYVQQDVAVGSAAAIARFYREVLGARADVVDDAEGVTAHVASGSGQTLRFHEKAGPLPAYEGAHVAIYLADFSRPYRWLLQRGLITEESNRHQYRYQDIVDVESGAVLTVLEHEMRSLKHPYYGRQLVNRDVSQTGRHYVPGQDDFRWRRA
ncbi:VOC family protein [Candidimonas nitroreducens]|uniref:VOC domain-containing protein n=1 Tax=Candidimonas nitroreducens TaxID=683354 RepID=A0A225M8K2_9BURK|nr:VOC family protein [Candidimonas nitroreducens]OWT57674.1 hypothetical protein CEY11_16680 [Candidimonas nitroreducens]